jgi:hypothetical protein
MNSRVRLRRTNRRRDERALDSDAATSMVSLSGGHDGEVMRPLCYATAVGLSIRYGPRRNGHVWWRTEVLRTARSSRQTPFHRHGVGGASLFEAAGGTAEP